MPNRAPYLPIGIKIGILIDDETKLGVLIIETDEGDFDFAVKLRVVDILNIALEMISTELRGGETRQ
jgi:hypothetical protein